VDSRAIIKMLKADGWKLDRVSGDHHVFKHPVKPGIVVVPHPRKDMPKGTEISIMRQAKLR
jgi:predicted RNA binding protein YcfA (HicA-like mRNA interferase family)